MQVVLCCPVVVVCGRCVVSPTNTIIRTNRTNRTNRRDGGVVWLLKFIGRRIWTNVGF